MSSICEECELSTMEVVLEVKQTVRCRLCGYTREETPAIILVNEEG